MSGNQAADDNGQDPQNETPAETNQDPDSGLFEGIADDHPVRAEIDRLRRESASKRVAANKVKEQNEELQTQLKDAKTPEEFQALVQEHQGKVEELQSKYEVELLRERVARQTKLDEDFFEFLTADTEEDLVKQAEKLSKRGGTRQQAPTPDPTGGREPKRAAQTTEDAVKAIKNSRGW